jgi:hypothetical protein
METTMQYLLMLYIDEAAATRMTPAEMAEGGAAYTAYTEALKQAGVLRGANRLQSTAAATTVRLVDGKPQVLDGPFADSKEQLGGYYLIEAKDLNDAIQVAAKIPSSRIGSIEVRPIMSFDA